MTTVTDFLRDLTSSTAGVVVALAPGHSEEPRNAGTALSRVDAHVKDAETDLLMPRRYEVRSERTVEAMQVLANALLCYRAPDGYEGYLTEAAWQLEQIGKDAWPALTQLAFSSAPECEFFLAAMVRLEGIDEKNRARTLRAAAKNPDGNVRSRLLELLDEMTEKMNVEIVRALASPESPDDSVTDRAREVLQGQAS